MVLGYEVGRHYQSLIPNPNIKELPEKSLKTLISTQTQDIWPPAIIDTADAVAVSLAALSIATTQTRAPLARKNF